MQAIAIKAPGGPDVLTLIERPKPEPEKGEVLVQIRAAGLNQADILQRQGRYSAPPGFPADIPGLEFAGVVEKLGAGVSGFALGERVFGLTGGGAYAQYLVINAQLLTKIPESLSFEQAAAIPEAFITAYDAMLSQAGLASGEAVLINAVGSGVGVAAVQIACAIGATTIGTSRSPSKLDKAKEYGLAYGIAVRDGSFSDQVKQITQGAGADVILELVGGSYLKEDIQAAAVAGRIILVGLLNGNKVELDLAAILSKRLNIKGTTLRARPLDEKMAVTKTFDRHLIPLFKKGVLRPVIDRVFPLSEAACAHAYLEEHASFGKLVLTIN